MFVGSKGRGEDDVTGDCERDLLEPLGVEKRYRCEYSHCMKSVQKLFCAFVWKVVVYCEVDEARKLLFSYENGWTWMA